MAMTTGEWMFVVGIAGAAFFMLLLIVMLATAGRKRRRLLDRINREL